MIRSLFTSAAGMRSMLDQQDVIANNLANASTPGFKRSSTSFLASVTEAQATADKAITPQTAVHCTIPTMVVHTDARPGMLTDTKVPSNLAIDGDGSFVVSTPAGEQLTRSGAFTLNQTGQLTNGEGNPVLGEGGPIQVSGTNWTVGVDGTIKSNGQVLGKLRIEGAAQPGRVVQGSLEDSNVNVVQEMVSMITGLRSYEANQKAIQAIDSTLDKAINQMGRSA